MKKAFALFPHRCCVSNKLIWFESGYKVSSNPFWHNLNMTDFWTKEILCDEKRWVWYTPDEFILGRLSGRIG